MRCCDRSLRIFPFVGCTDHAIPIERVRIAWEVGDDSKDSEMYPYIQVRDQQGRILVDSGGEGRTWATVEVVLPFPFAGRRIRVNAAWEDHRTYGPFELPILGQWTLDQCAGARAVVGQRSSKDGVDTEWHTTFSIDVRIGGQWFTVRPSNHDKNEFKWGDGKPDAAEVLLSCPNI